jgi:hypothetical protein
LSSLGGLTRRVRSTRMKPTAMTFLLVLSIIVAAEAKPPKTRGRPNAQQQAPAGPQPPSARLSMFAANHLDAILDPIDQHPPLPRTRISQLQAAFTDEAAKAREPEKAQYQAAIAVCLALNSAMDEREQTAASIAGSAAAHGPSDLGARRKDVPTQGTWADARLARIEKREEAHEEANRKQEAAQKDDFLTQQHKNAWIQRAQQIRQNIQLLMAREREAERAAEQAKAAAVAPPAPVAQPSAIPQ